MFDPASRYFTIETATLELKGAEGEVRRITYKRRRFIPALAGHATLVEHSVLEGERLDNITARYLGDPTQFWRVCDANLVLCPEDLEETGRRILITQPTL
jgi:hypothetical protein